MGFMEQAAASLATKYGVVSEGKYEGCKIAMGNPRDAKVTAANSFSQVIFIDGKEEAGRYDITKLRIASLGENEKGIELIIFFNDEEKSIFTLEKKDNSKDSFITSLLKSFIGPKRTPEQAHADIYHNMVIFFRQTCMVMIGDAVDTFEAYFAKNNVLDDLTQKLIALYKEKIAPKYKKKD